MDDLDLEIVEAKSLRENCKEKFDEKIRLNWGTVVKQIGLPKYEYSEHRHVIKVFIEHVYRENNSHVLLRGYVAAKSVYDSNHSFFLLPLNYQALFNSKDKMLLCNTYRMINQPRGTTNPVPNLITIRRDFDLTSPKYRINNEELFLTRGITVFKLSGPCVVVKYVYSSNKYGLAVRVPIGAFSNDINNLKSYEGSRDMYTKWITIATEKHEEGMQPVFTSHLELFPVALSNQHGMSSQATEFVPGIAQFNTNSSNYLYLDSSYGIYEVIYTVKCYENCSIHSKVNSSMVPGNFVLQTGPCIWRREKSLVNGEETECDFLWIPITEKLWVVALEIQLHTNCFIRYINHVKSVPNSIQTPLGETPFIPLAEQMISYFQMTNKGPSFTSHGDLIHFAKTLKDMNTTNGASNGITSSNDSNENSSSLQDTKKNVVNNENVNEEQQQGSVTVSRISLEECLVGKSDPAQLPCPPPYPPPATLRMFSEEKLKISGDGSGRKEAKTTPPGLTPVAEVGKCEERLQPVETIEQSKEEISEKVEVENAEGGGFISSLFANFSFGK